MGIIPSRLAVILGGAAPVAGFPAVALTSDITPSPYVASAYDAVATPASSYDAWKAFDQAPTVRWFINNLSYYTMPIYLELDFGATNAFAAVNYTLFVTDRNNALKTWTLEGSHDESTWDTLDTQSLGSMYIFQPDSGVYSAAFTFTNAVSYRYYRLAITVGFSISFLEVSEVRFNL